MHLKVLVSLVKKMVMIIMLWLRIYKILAFEVNKFCWIFAESTLFWYFNLHYLVSCCSDLYKTYYFLKEHDEVVRMDISKLTDLDFLLRPVQICKKCTIFGNLKTVTQEGKITSLFHLPLELYLFMIFIFVFESYENSFSWGPPFGPFWSAKYWNLWGGSCEITNLSCLIQKTYTLRKVKNQVLIFL